MGSAPNNTPQVIVKKPPFFGRGAKLLNRKRAPGVKRQDSSGFLSQSLSTFAAESHKCFVYQEFAVSECFLTEPGRCNAEAQETGLGAHTLALLDENEGSRVDAS